MAYFFVALQDATIMKHQHVMLSNQVFNILQ